MDYLVKIYFNGIYWDGSYAGDMSEAEYFKSYMEDKNKSILDRMNHDVISDFMKEFDIENAEDIEVTTKIIRL